MEMLDRVSQLNSGFKIPLIGLGTAALPQNEDDLKEAVATALKVHFCYISTSQYVWRFVNSYGGKLLFS